MVRVVRLPYFLRSPSWRGPSSGSARPVVTRPRQTWRRVPQARSQEIAKWRRLARASTLGHSTSSSASCSLILQNVPTHAASRLARPPAKRSDCLSPSRLAGAFHRSGARSPAPGTARECTEIGGPALVRRSGHVRVAGEPWRPAFVASTPARRRRARVELQCGRASTLTSGSIVRT